MSGDNNPYFIYWVAMVGALGGLLFGYDTGVISGALIFLRQSFHISVLTQEFIVSSVVLGALIGSSLSGRMADHYGRRAMLMASALLFIIGTLATTFALNVCWLIVGRFIIGSAIGIASYTTPLFISEMAPTKYRGAFVLLNAITITGGEAIAFLVDYAFAFNGSWRFMFMTGIIPAIILFFGMLILPETPRWLVMKGNLGKAKTTLQQIRHQENVSFELLSIQNSFSLAKANWSLLFSKEIRPVMVIGIALGIFQQFFGINTIMYYGPTIFQAAGFKSALSQILATFGMGLVNTIMSAVCVLLIDRIGRRKLLLSGSLIAAISLGIVGLAVKHINHFYYAQWIAVISMVTYIAGYCISVGSLFWLIIAEIFPLSIRGLGMSMATAIQWAANFLVSMTFLTIIQTIGATNTFWLYGCMCILCYLYCYYCVPETKGVSLETIERNLAENKPTRELGQPI